MVDIIKKILDVSISSNVIYIVLIFTIIIFTLKYYAKSQPFIEQRKLRSARHLLTVIALILSSTTLAFYYKEYRTATQYAFKGYEEKLNTEQAKKEVASIANNLTDKKEKEHTEFKPIQPKEETTDMLAETTDKVLTYFIPKNNNNQKSNSNSNSKYNIVTKKTTTITKQENVIDEDNTLPIENKPSIQEKEKEKENNKLEDTPTNNNNNNTNNNVGSKEENTTTVKPNTPTDKPTTEQKPIEENKENTNTENKEMNNDTEILQAVTLFQQEINQNNLIPLRNIIQSVEQIEEEETITLTIVQATEIKKLYNDYQYELKEINSIHSKKRIMPYIQEFDFKIVSLYHLLTSKNEYSLTEYQYVIQLYAESEYLLYNM